MPPVCNRVLAFAVTALFASVPALAQSGGSQAQARPKIGLALGGGSARGIAHVGVLEWFEEHHIPIDFVVGTSMGGLIAGAYASGMTPAEIRALMKAADWDLMFLSDSPYKYKTSGASRTSAIFRRSSNSGSSTAYRCRAPSTRGSRSR
jgi:predicted acylesterase/phospholipase RssA